MKRFLAFLFCLNQPSWAAYSLIQEVNGLGNTTTSLTLTMTPTAGNNIYCAASVNTAAQQISSITGEKSGGTWTRCTGSQSNTNKDTEVWYLQNVDTSSTTITIYESGNGDSIRANCQEWSGGLLSGNPCDISGINNGTSTTPTTASVATTNAGDVCIALDNSANGTSLVSGPTNGFNALGTGNAALANFAYKIETVTQAAENTVWTLGSSVVWDSSISCFLPVASASSPSNKTGLIINGGKMSINGANVFVK